MELLLVSGMLLGLLVASAMAVQLTASRSPRRWVEALRVLLLAVPLGVAGYALIDDLVSHRVLRALQGATLVPGEVAKVGSIAFLAVILALLVRGRAWPSEEQDELPRGPNAARRLALLSLGATALSLLVLLRTLESVAAASELGGRWGMGLPPFARPFAQALRDEVNLVLPLVVVGVAALLVIFLAERRERPRTARIVSGMAVVVCLTPALVGLAALVNLSKWVSYDAVVPSNFQGVIPGRAAEIGAEVMSAIRTSLRERQGRVQLPGGAERRFFLYAGPGAPSPPEGPLEYAKLFEHPGCVLLPQGPPGNRGGAGEPFAVHPRRASEIYSLGDLAQGADQAVSGATDFRFSRLLWSDQPYFKLADDYGYVFTLRRHLRSVPRRSKVFDEALYEIKVLVFRGFYYQKGKLSGPYHHAQFVTLERP